MSTPQTRYLLLDPGLNPFNPLSESVDSLPLIPACTDILIQQVHGRCTVLHAPAYGLAWRFPPRRSHPIAQRFPPFPLRQPTPSQTSGRII